MHPTRSDGLRCIAAAAGIAIAAASSPAIGRADSAVLDRVRRWRRDSWRRPVMAISALGETPIMAAALVVVSARHPRQALRDVTVLGLALAGREMACRSLRRPRPNASGWWKDPTGFSMPSRHTMTAMLGLALVADRLTASHPTKESSWRRTARLAGALVASSRIVLGVHWPTDTVAGYFLGIGIHAASAPAKNSDLAREASMRRRG